MFLRCVRSLSTSPFGEYLLTDSIIQKLEAFGVTNPSSTQKALLPLIHAHSNIILKDQTGSGKTLGLVMGILAKKNPKLVEQRDFEKLEKQYQDFLKRRLGERNYLETLFIVPTVELAQQIYSWTLKLSRDLPAGNNEEAGNNKEKESDSLVGYDEDMKDDSLVQMVVSTMGMEEQKNLLEKNIPRILIGTPKRLMDLYTANAIDVTRLQTVIVDEVDRIIEPLSRYAYVKQKVNRKTHKPVGEILLDAICSAREGSEQKRMGIGAQKDVARRRPLQMIVSSATVNNPLKYFLKKKGWMKNSLMLNLNVTPPSTIKHKAYYVDNHQLLIPITQSEIDQADPESPTATSKFNGSLLNTDSLSECIYAISEKESARKALIFIQSDDSLVPLRDCLKLIGLNIRLLSDSNLHLRDEASKKYDFVLARENESRGLDVPGLDHVILVGDYSSQSYIHTSGRTGRFGAQGTAISILLDSIQKQRYLKMMKRLGLKISE
jgi:superfamily II DNA/RNA helicase